MRCMNRSTVLGGCWWALCSAVVGLGIYVTPAMAQPTPYNPYAESHDTLPPVAADGTLNWGSFYKSAAIQKAYERLWNLGACRNTNKAITIPVERNKLVINNLPEASFSGRVRMTSGTLAGGMVAFTEGAAIDPAGAVLIAQLHPAGVTQVQVGGRISSAAIRPGMTVRLRSQVNDKGRATDPVRSIDIVTPPVDFKPDPVRSNQVDTIVGTILTNRNRMLLVKVDAGKIRRLVLPLAEDAEVMIVDAAQLDLIGPGDEVEITGRRWSGEGAAGAGTVFASRIVVTKAPIAETLASDSRGP
ncbi:MAG: hypothetical protein WCQ77_01390 [Planctomycetota bacterium]